MFDGSTTDLVAGESDELTGKSGAGLLVVGAAPHATSSTTEIIIGSRYFILSPFLYRKDHADGINVPENEKRRVCLLVSSVLLLNSLRSAKLDVSRKDLECPFVRVVNAASARGIDWILGVAVERPKVITTLHEVCD